MQAVLHPIIGPRKELHDLKGRVALITGGANGIGFQIARAFASVGCHVYMTNRKEDQGSQAIKDITDEFPDAKVEWLQADLGTLQDVKKLAQEFESKQDRLDLLILSAGINSDQPGKTNDGVDRHFQVNFLGHFFLINLLYPLIRKTSQMPDTPPPRIVFESSEMHRGAPKNVHFGSAAEINDESIGSTEVYGRTKLAMILFSKFGLAEKVIKPNNDDVYALSVHPGIVLTQMQEQWKSAYPGLLGQLLSVANKAASRSIEQGSYSALYAATSPDIEKQGERFYYYTDPGQAGKESAQANDKWLGEALWNLSHRMVKDLVGEDALKSWNK